MFLKGERDVVGEAVGEVDLGRGADLVLPLDTALRGGEVAAAGVNEALKAEI